MKRVHEEEKGRIDPSHEQFGRFLKTDSMFDSYHKEEGRRHTYVFLTYGCGRQLEKATLWR
jgi:hypothetical protein